MPGEATAIECVMQGQIVLLPAQAVSQFVEYEVALLPLARPHVAGVGLRGKDLVVLLRVHETALEAPRRVVTGALLFPRGDGDTLWAIEVSRVVSIVRARAARATAGSWLANTTTSDGRSLPWLDVDRMLANLGAARGEA